MFSPSPRLPRGAPHRSLFDYQAQQQQMMSQSSPFMSRINGGAAPLRAHTTEPRAAAASLYESPRRFGSSAERAENARSTQSSSSRSAPMSPQATPLLSTLTSCKHADLQSISAETVQNILNNAEDCCNERVIHIIDCRYGYEYAGGHIRGAVNLMTEREIVAFFFDTYYRPVRSSSAVFIFHCEFSSVRGPAA